MFGNCSFVIELVAYLLPQLTQNEEGCVIRSTKGYYYAKTHYGNSYCHFNTCSRHGKALCGSGYPTGFSARTTGSDCPSTTRQPPCYRNRYHYRHRFDACCPWRVTERADCSYERYQHHRKRDYRLCTGTARNVWVPATDYPKRSSPCRAAVGRGARTRSGYRKQPFGNRNQRCGCASLRLRCIGRSYYCGATAPALCPPRIFGTCGDGIRVQRAHLYISHRA